MGALLYELADLGGAVALVVVAVIVVGWLLLGSVGFALLVLDRRDAR